MRDNGEMESVCKGEGKRKRRRVCVSMRQRFIIQIMSPSGTVWDSSLPLWSSPTFRERTLFQLGARGRRCGAAASLACPPTDAAIMQSSIQEQLRVRLFRIFFRVVFVLGTVRRLYCRVQNRKWQMLLFGERHASAVWQILIVHCGNCKQVTVSLFVHTQGNILMGFVITCLFHCCFCHNFHCYSTMCYPCCNFQSVGLLSI